VARLDVIDVSIVGGPDVGTRVTTTPISGGRRLDIELYTTADSPALVHRVGVVLETDTVREAVVHGWLGRSEARRRAAADTGTRRNEHPSSGPALPAGTAGPGDLASHQMVATDSGTVGWIGTGRHPAVVVVQRDGWMVTAWALLGGVILGPGETLALDPLVVVPDLDLDAGMVVLAEAWSSAADLGPGGRDRRSEGPQHLTLGTAPSTVWLADRTAATAKAAVATLADLGVGGVVFDDPGPDGLDAVLTAAAGAGLRPAIRIDIGRAGGTPGEGGIVDLTRPDAATRLETLGAARRAGGIDYVLVDGCSATFAPGARWGDASLSPLRALRIALESLRRGIGPDAVLHLSDAPLAVAPGIADVVEAMPPAGPGGDLGRTAETAHRRRALHGRVWAAATAPLLPEDWDAPDPARAPALESIGTTTGTVVLVGDPEAWSPDACHAVRRIATR
jgi:hypothetical protein